jgi:phosphorylcholine metabolism protein LicD
MKTKAVKISWDDQKIKLKAKYPNLSESDLHFEPGKKDKMYHKIQTKLGKSADELTKIISEL